MIRSCLGLLLLVAVACLHQGQAKTWVWQGALTPTSIDFKLKTDEPEFRLVAVPQQQQQSNAYIATLVKDGMYRFPPATVSSSSSWNPSTVRLLHLRLDRLAPNTSYTWSSTGELTGRFTTPAPAHKPFNFTVAFGSCADNDSSSDIFSLISGNRNPLAFIHMGDLHYGNLDVNSQEAFADMYDRTLGNAKQSLLYRNTPVVYMWDDHDFGPNNADKSSASRPAALATYHRFVPHYPLAAAEEEDVYQSFVLGRVLFILTDTSSQRETHKTTLGRRQLEWLLNKLTELSSSDQRYAAGVWISTLPWIDDHYKWGEFPEERQRIADHILRLQLSSKLIILSGDAHMLAVDDGSHSAGRMPVFHAAAIDAKPTTKGGPYSHGVWPGRNQYGTLTVEDDSAKGGVCFYFEGWRMVQQHKQQPRLKRLVAFDTCGRPGKNYPSKVRKFTPSPHTVQRAWKQVKKLVERHGGEEGGALVRFVTWVDSSQITLNSFLDPQLALFTLTAAALLAWAILRG